MATKSELEGKIKVQEKMKASFEKQEGKESFVKRLDDKLLGFKKELKEILDAEKPKEVAKKPKKSNKIAGSMTQAECMKMLETMKGNYLKSESTTKKNIKSGRAIEDGSLKPSASLKNEAETIENKSDSGQTINKKEQKAIAFNIEAIVKNCVEMIKYKKDADKLIKDLIRKLGEIRADIASGRLKPGAQN